MEGATVTLPVTPSDIRAALRTCALSQRGDSFAAAADYLAPFALGLSPVLPREEHQRYHVMATAGHYLGALLALRSLVVLAGADLGPQALKEMLQGLLG